MKKCALLALMAACSSSTTPRTGPVSGALWVLGGVNVNGNTANSAFEYAATQLQTSSAVAPAVALTLSVTPGLNVDANALAFDAQGNLWVANDSSSTVVEYAASDLVARGSPTPLVTIQLPHASTTVALAFDAHGNLWVANRDSSDLVEFVPAQLEASGQPLPNVIVAVKEGGTTPGQPLAIAFDAEGSLWVVNSTGSVVKYAATQLSSNGAPAPAVVLHPQIPQPYYVAFDEAGNLWLANAPSLNNGTLVGGPITELAHTSLTVSGSPSPTRTLTPPTGTSVAFPTSIAFDASGDLWYSDFDNATIGEFSAAQLLAAGQASPVTIVSTAPLVGTSVAFNPHAGSLPLH